MDDREMAPFPKGFSESLSSMIFNLELERYRSAYAAALKSLESVDADLETSIRRKLNLGPDDPFPDNDSDDLLQDIYDNASQTLREAEEAMALVRKAFLIVLFHMWERHANRKLNISGYDPAKVEQWLQGLGRTVDFSSLDHLRLAANCAKHGPGNSCKLLFGARPDLFLNTSHPRFVPQEANLHITPQNMDEFFELVRMAGSKA